MFLKLIRLVLLLSLVSGLGACKVKVPEDEATWYKYVEIIMQGDEKSYLFAKRMIEDGTSMQYLQTKFQTNLFFYQGKSTKMTVWSKKIFDLAKANGADVNFTFRVGDNSWTPFMDAMRFGKLDAAKYLQSLGADPYRVVQQVRGMPDYENALSMSGTGNCLECLKYLEGMGFDITDRNPFACKAYRHAGSLDVEYQSYMESKGLNPLKC